MSQPTLKEDDTYKIGEFSKLSFLTIQALRHYDEIGLLKPARKRTSTGYRYYAGKQPPRSHFILAMKNLGMTPDEVLHKRIIIGSLDIDQSS